ncbi:putative receptor protein kinase zmpk1 [Phtheirospermum japonicum]|uniref:Receptor-like serine/threonine-protein kinase n=1 Tax=Phtheirospermum japonicum TaxID=374723 RepID=A0A830D4R9_9LAMI|nr:putative receptor protein kinase zmpk1 [Phtheirospermum japonicum]
MRSLVILEWRLLSSFPIATSKSHNNHLKGGDSIPVRKESDFITSPDNSFTCGFHSLSLGTNAYWFAVWFTDSKDKTVIWTANRDRPVNSKGSKATIRRDGTMVLTDVDNTVVWQTNTTSTDISKAELLNTGNLVLRNKQGIILWQSFDFPTDTLLPSQTFTKNTRLKSALRKGGYESGYFNLYFGSDNVLRLISDSPDTSTTYRPNPDIDIYKSGRTNYNSSRIAILDETGRFLSSDQLQFNTSDMGFGVKRRLTMDYDGNLRVYSLNISNGLWDITWQAIQQSCGVKGICGKYAICIYAPEPRCTCPPGFGPSDTRNWNAGCKPKFNQTLLNSRNVKFVEIPHTDYYGFDLNTTDPVTLETCRASCLNDFRCQGFSYRLLGQGFCFVKSALFNGYASPDFPASIYIKVPVSMKTSKPNIFHASGSTCGSGEAEIQVGSGYDFNSKEVRWVYIYSFVAALGAIEAMFVLLGWWFLFKKHGVPSSVEAGYRMISSQFRRYDYSELKKATDNFKEELGRGGSGAVYRGILSNRLVAVKRLGDVFRAEEEFFAEISTIGKINHMNLVRICGYCSEKRHKLLVYEFIDNLSLDRYIFGLKFLDWKQRYGVALGTAKGLAYLHHECLEWVIHCDVKPENILLDGEFQPKIADFGLARLTQREGPGSEFSRIRGTKGYMAPEWALNHPITAKVDVFGFGVVILEMVRGIRVCNWDDDEQENGLMKFVRKMKGNIEFGGLDWVESVVDSRLEGGFSRKQAAVLIEIGVSCVEEDRNKRPTMASVVQTLLWCKLCWSAEDETEVSSC